MCISIAHASCIAALAEGRGKVDLSHEYQKIWLLFYMSLSSIVIGGQLTMLVTLGL